MRLIRLAEIGTVVLTSIAAGVTASCEPEGPTELHPAPGSGGAGGASGDAAGGGDASGHVGPDVGSGGDDSGDCDRLDCDALGRGCDEAEDACGACLDGFTSQGSQCVRDECLSCAERHRECDATESPAECGRCMNGYVAAGTECVPLRDCATGCAADQGCYPASGACHSCAFRPACDDPEGETGRVLIREAKEGAECLCETRPGFYTSASRNAQRCDADGDGWVSQAAQASIEGEDPILQLNARCQVLVVRRLVLENEAGARLAVDLDADLPLYESVGNDGAGAASPHASYGARQLDPEVLNGFTKACVSEVDDFNGNGAADVAEQPGVELGRDLGWNAKLSSYVRRYAEFAYYLELYDGAHEAASSGGAGSYRIVERERTDPSGKGVPLRYRDEMDEYWRQCGRHVDADYGPAALSRAGGDFSQFGEEWGGSVAGGMVHSAQFKCGRIVPQQKYATESTLEANPETLFVSGERVARRSADGVTQEYDWVPNRCVLEEALTPGPGGTAFAQLTCTPLPVSGLEPGVYWFAAGFEPYTRPEGYRHGCIDECAERGEPAPQCHECRTGDFGRERIEAIPASEPCDDGVCDGHGNCGDCAPATFRCKDERVQQACTPEQHWVDSVVCRLCDSGICYSECVPSERRCFAGIPQTCDARGRWQNDAECLPGYECVGAGLCLSSDGQPCAGVEACASGTCNVFYGDADGDGFGGTEQLLCGTTPPTGYYATAADCCDSDANAWPGQTQYFVSPRSSCGGYDFDCSGGGDRQYGSPSSTTCSPCWPSGCCSFNPGWAGSVPACGATGTYWVNAISTQQRVQACR